MEGFQCSFIMRAHNNQLTSMDASLCGRWELGDSIRSHYCKWYINTLACQIAEVQHFIEQWSLQSAHTNTL